MERNYETEPLMTQDIGIEGMTCDHCVRRVEKALKGRPGVTDVKVSREAARATITFDPRQTNLPDLHQAVTKSGYKPTAS